MRNEEKFAIIFCIRWRFYSNTVDCARYDGDFQCEFPFFHLSLECAHMYQRRDKHLTKRFQHENVDNFTEKSHR